MSTDNVGGVVEHGQWNGVVSDTAVVSRVCVVLLVGDTQHKLTGNLFFSFKTNARRASLADDLSIVVDVRASAGVMYIHILDGRTSSGWPTFGMPNDERRQLRREEVYSLRRALSL